MQANVGKIKNMLKKAVETEKENLMKVRVHMYPSLRQFMIHEMAPPIVLPTKKALAMHSGNEMMGMQKPVQQLSVDMFIPYKKHVADLYKKVKSEFQAKTQGDGIPAMIESFSLSSEKDGKKTKYDVIILTSTAITMAQRQMFPFFQKFPENTFLLVVLLKNEKVVHVDSISLQESKLAPPAPIAPITPIAPLVPPIVAEKKEEEIISLPLPIVPIVPIVPKVKKTKVSKTEIPAVAPKKNTKKPKV